ncbi:hypothetical protein AZI86_17010 [Bdellovibrio bacteriovorus]|uniref:HTH cro/C1-type domain-containing protein n=1 Tax=Bdellovibrio bacteriovorus TaxID=959 RepID=A0A150WEQ2_BDEBC|nr:helix-turn-helix transcriptional regulator [Bdellovibrio bacteriovorus]KYG61413.1 hypothetical protein AZI86_17010 [Bdellovibrio bacteriovorus]
MQWNSHFINLLEAEFNKIRLRNPRISRRGFARLLGVSPSTMFRVLSGELQVSSERALHMLENLDVEPAALNELIYLMNHRYKMDRASEKMLDETCRLTVTGSREDLEVIKNEVYGLCMSLKNKNSFSELKAKYSLHVLIELKNDGLMRS